VVKALEGTAHNRRRGWRWLWLLLLGTSVGAPPAGAQTCQSAADMDASVETALETTGKRYFDMSARGDTAALQQNSIASVAASFAGIEAAVKENQAAFNGANAKVRPPFLLTTEGLEPLARAEFLCGVFGKSGQTKDSAVFVLPNLPPGKYGVTILDVNGSQGARTLTFVLQQVFGDWKLAGFYARPSGLRPRCRMVHPTSPRFQKQGAESQRLVVLPRGNSPGGSRGFYEHTLDRQAL